MSAGAQHIYAALVHINRNMAESLDSICVEQNSVFLGNGAYLADRLNGSDLIVRKHDGD